MEAGLPIPAYCQLLKLSHAFNVLDARGAVGVTERATCFGAMRGLARSIAGALWLDARLSWHPSDRRFLTVTQHGRR